MTPAKIQEIMLEAAPLCDLLIMDYFAAKKTWHIAADKESEIFGELDEARGVLVLSMPLTSPAAMDQQLLDLALRFGHVWDASGGFRLSLETAEGPFWLIVDFGTEGLTPRALAGAVRDMVAKGAAWRELIQSPPRSEDEQDALTSLSETGLFRV